MLTERELTVAGAGVCPSAATTLQSVRRASRLLLAAAGGGLSAREAVAMLSVSLPTAYHLLNSLASEGLLAREGDRYVLGPMATIIADGVGYDMRAPDRYIAALRGLVDRTGETAYLSAWRGDELRILSVIEGTRVVRVSGLAVGYSRDLHARTSARVLLAFADPQFSYQRLSNLRLRRLTPTTITSREELRRELKRIRATGIAVGRDEYVTGLTAASVPISENGAVMAAITVAAPSERFRATEPRLITALREAGVSASHTGRDVVSK
jgi:DNA-binding IclR family transcriptional regulator